MSASHTEAVDVRDMTCSQALAVVAQAASCLSPGQTMTILYNAHDVKQDLVIWAKDLGYRLRDLHTEGLSLTRGH